MRAGSNKATASNGSGGSNCVEVIYWPTVEFIGVRDSKNPDRAILSFSPEEWEAFIAGVKAGEFDL